MAVVLSSVGRIKPGRYQDFLSQSAEAVKLYERLGSEPPRLFTAGVAGEAFGSWTFSVEFPDLPTYGAFADTLAADSEMQALTMRLHDTNAPASVEQVSLAVEIPGDRKSAPRRGRVMVVNVSRPHPGGLERTLELGQRAGRFATRHGAVSARLFELAAAGSGAGLLLSTWEFKDVSSYGRCIDAFLTDPKGQALAAESAGAGATFTRVFEGLYTQIPL